MTLLKRALNKLIYLSIVNIFTNIFKKLESQSQLRKQLRNQLRYRFSYRNFCRPKLVSEIPVGFSINYPKGSPKGFYGKNHALFLYIDFPIGIL